MVTGWKEMEEKWYFFGTDGAMVVNEMITDSATGKQYKADKKGVCRESVNGIITIKLKKSYDFVKITDTVQRAIYYGGDQEWFESSSNSLMAKIGPQGGCGTVASANMLAYLADNNSKYAGLYRYQDFSKDNFLQFMEDVFEYVTPYHILKWKTFGIWPVSKLGDGVKKFSRERGIVLQSKIISNCTSVDKLIEFVISGLEKDSPVALLMGTKGSWDVNVTYPSGGGAYGPFHFHWVTITEIYVGESNKKVRAKVSSWGGYTEIDLIKSLQGEMLYFGLIYFE